jgi:2Fe-2S ferredoxin
MPTVVYVEPNGQRHEIEAPEHGSVMSTALDNLIPGIVGDCGGEMSCATCHVFVEGDWPALGTVGPDEDSLLEATAVERQSNSRLSCQLHCSRAINGIVVRIPEEQ